MRSSPFLADGMGRSVVDGTQAVALGVLSRARGRRWKQTCASRPSNQVPTRYGR